MTVLDRIVEPRVALTVLTALNVIAMALWAGSLRLRLVVRRRRTGGTASPLAGVTHASAPEAAVSPAEPATESPAAVPARENPVASIPSRPAERHGGTRSEARLAEDLKRWQRRIAERRARELSQGRAAAAARLPRQGVTA